MNDDVLTESLRDLYEQAPCGYIFTAPDGTLMRVNQTFLDWTGYSRDELLSRRLQDLLTVAGKMYYENLYAPLLTLQGAVQEVAFDIVRMDGTRLPVLINSVLRRDADGNPMVVASALFSAVDRRAYERELLQARTRAEQLAEVVTASSDAIITCSREGKVLSWNTAAEHLLRYASSSVSTLVLHDILPFSNDAEYDRMLHRLYEGEAVNTETVTKRADGRLIDVSVSITPHMDEMGAINSLSAIIRDISERRMLERLQQEFLAMASHELRTPLTSIRGQAQLMRRRAAYSDFGTEVIIAQTQRLSGLIDDLLLASQIEADRLDLHFSEVNLVTAARSAGSLVQSDVCAIHVEAPDQPIVIRADERRLDQVFSNLLTNAVKYSPEGGEIEVRVMDGDGRARVEVIDQGLGIQQSDIPHLFNRFYRSAAVAGEFKGAGLGLYITRRIVEEHGGTIEVESAIGQGSTFRLMFPTTE